LKAEALRDPAGRHDARRHATRLVWVMWPVLRGRAVHQKILPKWIEQLWTQYLRF